jgi:hypothetical protein
MPRLQGLEARDPVPRRRAAVTPGAGHFGRVLPREGTID